MKKTLIIISLIFIGCEDSYNKLQNPNLLFVASEGTYGDSNGSISVFSEEEKIQTVENLGDVVQSIHIDDDKLFVIVNNSHLIKRYSITESGLNLPGIEISTNNSSPREMVIVGNKLYFTNWNSHDVKVLDLVTFSIISSISLDGIPEDIVSKDEYLYVSIPQLELYDTNNGSTVVQININTEEITNTYEVGRGPEQMLIDNDDLYISRTFYSSDWASATYGSSMIDLETEEILIIDYGMGMICGGNILKINNQIYRTVDGGIAPLTTDLNLNISSKIGSHQNLYSASSSNENLYLGISDYVAPDTVYIHDQLGELIRVLPVGVLPKDFAFWTNN